MKHLIFIYLFLSSALIAGESETKQEQNVKIGMGVGINFIHESYDEGFSTFYAPINISDIIKIEPLFAFSRIKGVSSGSSPIEAIEKRFIIGAGILPIIYKGKPQFYAGIRYKSIISAIEVTENDEKKNDVKH